MILKEQKRTRHKVGLFGFVQHNTKTQTAKTAGCVKNKSGKLLLGSLVTDQLNVDLDYRRGTKMTERKYCIATCHRGTEMGIFLSGPDDERLTLEEAKEADSGSGKFLFDCTPEEYWKEEHQLPAPGC